MVICLVLWPIRLAWAYNFLYIHPTEGRPIGWEAETTIKYYLDPGKLGRLTNDQAHTLLKEAMKIWENASPYADVPHFEFAGYLPEDVDGTNYQKYVSLFTCYTDDLASCPSEAQKNLQTVIVFDEDDSILDNELCRIGSCTAYSAAKVFGGNSSNPGNTAQGIAVFGGGVDLETKDPYTITPSIVGIMVHELGHLLGLAHSVVNQEVFIGSETENSLLLPSMLSGYIVGVYSSGDLNGAGLNPDDIAGIINLYPKVTASTELGTIKGQILKSDGSPMMHVNVIARNIEDPLCEAYSLLSGRFCRHDLIAQSLCINEDGTTTSDGTFTFSGLPPGSYTLEVEEVVDADQALALSPGLLDPFLYGDAEFWNEGDAASEVNTISSEISLTAGETKENIDIVLNRSEVTDDRIKYIPSTTFTPGANPRCQAISTDYAALIGIEKTSNTSDNPTSSATSGCSLLP